MSSVRGLTSAFASACRPQVAAARRRTGACSLLLGVAAVAMFGCPWLPSVFPNWIRYFPVYLIVPVGICAVVSGVGALRDMRGQEAADRRRARAGILLGLVASTVPVAVGVWACWVLSNSYG
ncbi:hypothetical protein [Streptomyces sp. NRRL S-1824]|uniref:hypothetical protein n=1 Tax=Streptomyces sp. NRRL S-1824 TaxID=1463889 RepID=UPI001F2BA001|nr:hypothetical protein [Streptomyces sp. NRRL S-1824]